MKKYISTSLNNFIKESKDYLKDVIYYSDNFIFDNDMILGRLFLSDDESLILYDVENKALDIRCITDDSTIIKNFKDKMSDADREWKYFKPISIKQAKKLYKSNNINGFYYYPNLRI